MAEIDFYYINNYFELINDKEEKVKVKTEIQKNKKKKKKNPT